MNYRIVLSPGATAELNSAARWYEDIDPDLGSRFLAETDTVLQRIKIMPYAFRVRSGAFRQAVVKRFPYTIYYLVKIDVVVITAILHQRRADPPWLTQGNGHT